MNNIGIVADEYTTLAFRAMGVDMFPVENASEARTACQKLKKSEYKIVFLQEKWVPDVEDILEQRKDILFPLFIFIPDSTGTTGTAEKKIRQALEKALGTTNW